MPEDLLDSGLTRAALSKQSLCQQKSAIPSPNTPAHAKKPGISADACLKARQTALSRTCPTRAGRTHPTPNTLAPGPRGRRRSQSWTARRRAAQIHSKQIFNIGRTEVPSGFPCASCPPGSPIAQGNPRFPLAAPESPARLTMVITTGSQCQGKQCYIIVTALASKARSVSRFPRLLCAQDPRDA